MVKQYEPEYPRDARENEWSGRVTINVLVGPEGNVLKASLGHEELDKAALAAVKRWTFTPAKQRGRPVKVWVNIPFHFEL